MSEAEVKNTTKSKINFTKEQLNAIECTDKTLLVSAAAGSGKTATLTQRIIRGLLDKSSGASISNMLIVTFTNAAVNELKERIAKALRGAISENENDERLKEELYLLPGAKIMTIDAFCNEIVKRNTELHGLSPSYRIAEGAECEILSDMIMGSLYDAFLAGEMSDIISKEDFASLIYTLTKTGQSEKNATEVLLYLYTRTTSTPDGVEGLYPLKECYNTKNFKGVFDTVFGEFLRAQIDEGCEHYISILSPLVRELYDFSDKFGKYKDVAEADLYILKELKAARDYDSVHSILTNLSFPDLPRVKNEDKSPAMIEFAALHSDIKLYLREELYEKYFSYTTEKWVQIFDILYKLTNNVYKFLKKFDEVYTAEKIRRGICEYSDIERYAYKTLYNGDGKLSDIALEYQKQFSYIYIDEYQDVNRLQDSIFKAVAKDNNCFMVGDIKQSIYSFRSAAPDVFREMKASFPKFEDAKASPKASLFMSKNFRCDKHIIDFTNTVFDRIFGVLGASIDYKSEDSLSFAKVDKDLSNIEKRVSVTLMEPKALGEYYDDAEENKTLVREARQMAADIKELLKYGTKNNGEALKPSDIAIILRTQKGKAQIYSSALEDLGIKADVVDKKSFFLNKEVLLMLSLLNAIDNPYKDTYITALMLSPIFDFTADELVMVRKINKDAPIYTALKEYCETNPCFSKGREFIDTLKHYRTLSEGVPAHVLIARLYKETPIMSLAAQNGGRDNLTLLYSYAMRFEGASFKGLYSFICYINNLIEMDKRFDEGVADGGGSSDAVKITTIHSSKGLEYPVVYLGGCGADIRNNDSDKRIYYKEGFAMATSPMAPLGYAYVETAPERIIKAKQNEEIFEEELRMLYVALTRAREALYIYATPRAGTDLEKYLDKLDNFSKHLTPYSAKKLKSYFAIIAATSGIKPKIVLRERDEEGNIIDDDDTLPITQNTQEIAKNVNNNLPTSDEIAKRFNFEYKNKALTTLPEKMSVTNLYPSLLDEADEYEVRIFDNGEGVEDDEISDMDSACANRTKKRTPLPAFIEKSRSEESALSGIATHQLLQFASFENLLNGGVVAEVERLVEKEFLSKDDAKRVRVDEVERFISSELFKAILGAKNIYRELRFNLLLDASDFTLSEDKKELLKDKKILVQGVIDCLIENRDGTYRLVDYKTDRLSQRELRDKSLAEKKMREKHASQLGYYKKAVKSIFGKEPAACEVYSLHLGDTLTIL